MSPASVNSGNFLYFTRWLTLLQQQTSLGNIRWEKSEDGNTYSYFASTASVSISSVDGDGEDPYSLAVFDESGRPTGYWVVSTNPHSLRKSDLPPDLSQLTVELWEIVRTMTGTDPIMNMLQELEQLPPF